MPCVLYMSMYAYRQYRNTDCKTLHSSVSSPNEWAAHIQKFQMGLQRPPSVP